MAIPSLLCPYLPLIIAMSPLPGASFPQNTKRNSIVHKNVTVFPSPFSTLHPVARAPYVPRLQKLVREAVLVAAESNPTMRPFHENLSSAVAPDQETVSLRAPATPYRHLPQGNSSAPACGQESSCQHPRSEGSGPLAILHISHPFARRLQRRSEGSCCDLQFLPLRPTYLVHGMQHTISPSPISAPRDQVDRSRYMDGWVV